MNHVPARSAALDLAARASGAASAEALPPAAWAAETAAFCGVATVVAAATDDLGTLFQLAGGTAAAALIFGIPGALLLREAAGAPPGGARTGLAAAGAALAGLTLASWAATLTTLPGAGH